mgnify:CR=1 FL=1
MDIRKLQDKAKTSYTLSTRGVILLQGIAGIGISKSRLTENIEKRIIIIKSGISHENVSVGGVDNGSNERLCCPSG